MKQECERLNDCAFFKKYSFSNAQRAWIRLFCVDLEKSKECKRKIYFEEIGEPPPEDMNPIGETVEDPLDLLLNSDDLPEE